MSFWTVPELNALRDEQQLAIRLLTRKRPSLAGMMWRSHVPTDASGKPRIAEYRALLRPEQTWWREYKLPKLWR